MTFKLTIECDSDAFANYPEGEIKRILLDLASRVASPHSGNWHLRDANGVFVGEAVLINYSPT